MATLYYGKGNCTIEGSDIVGVQISYRGNVKIIDKTEDSHIVVAKNNKILIVPVGLSSPLNELFDYSGEIRIISVIASDGNAEKVPCTIKRVMDYPEIMDSNPEDMTVVPEKLSGGYKYKSKLKKTTVDKNILKNQSTKDGIILSKDDGSVYSGMFHVHLETQKIMSGADHTENLSLKIVKKIIKTIKTTPRKTISKPYSGGGSSGSGGGGY